MENYLSEVGAAKRPFQFVDYYAKLAVFVVKVTTLLPHPTF